MILNFLACSPVVCVFLSLFSKEVVIIVYVSYIVSFSCFIRFLLRDIKNHEVKSQRSIKLVIKTVLTGKNKSVMFIIYNNVHEYSP